MSALMSSKRRRQVFAAQEPRAQPFRDSDGRRIGGVDAVDHLGPAKRVEGPVDGGGGSFDGIALAPRRAHKTPADFGAGPAFRHPRTDAADPVATLFLDHREQRKAAQRPMARHHRHGAPGDGPGHGTADEARNLFIGHHRGPAVEIFRLRWTQDQARRFQRGTEDGERDGHRTSLVGGRSECRTNCGQITPQRLPPPLQKKSRTIMLRN